MIYLDHNATTKIKPEVIEAMSTVMLDGPHNASAVHSQGRKAKKLLEDARQQILQSLDASGAQVIFTGSGTEANNMVVDSFDTIVISATEHPSILKPATQKDPAIIAVDSEGVIKLDVLEETLKSLEGNKPLVSVMLANNETGVIQPIKKITELVYKYGGYVHTDAVQAVGKIPVRFNELNVDMLSVAGHKFGGPQGIGALILKKGLEIKPYLIGGGQEGYLRAGTEDIAGIVGMAKALELCTTMDSELRDYLESSLREIDPQLLVLSSGADRLPNTSCIALYGIDNNTQLISFDLAKIGISSGSACSSGKVNYSHVLGAMGVSEEVATTCIRVSMAKDNTKEEIDSFIEIWKKNFEKSIDKNKAA